MTRTPVRRYAHPTGKVPFGCAIITSTETRDGLIYMEKKHLYITLAMTAVVGAVLAVALLGGKKPDGVSAVPAESGTSTISEQARVAKTYSPKIPVGATLSVAKAETPASNNPNSDAKIKFFDLRASKSGFSVPAFVVTQGDSLSIDFTAVDGDYDLDIPYLGAYFSAVKQGETKKLPIDTSAVGTFVIECRSHCPASGQIKTSLVVLPR